MSLDDFQPASLHPEGLFWELLRGRAGLRGRGRASPGQRAQMRPGAPRGLQGLLPQSCLLPTGLCRERKTHLVSKIEKYISDNMGCNFATAQRALKSLCAPEQ